MIQFNANKDLFNQPIRLTKQCLRDPYLYIGEFCSNHSLYSVRELLAKWFEATLVLGPTENNPVDDLYLLYWFYDDMETLIEAAYLINKKRGKKKIMKKNKTS